jgi:hypothetical protein
MSSQAMTRISTRSLAVAYPPVNIADVERVADQKVVAMKETFISIGSQCALLDKVGNSIAELVRQLQREGILLEDKASLTLAREYMRIMHKPDNPKSEKTLHTYAGRLRDYLHMPPELVPDCICISAPVRDWVIAGNEVDVKFEACWWHGVVLSVSKCKLKVFWVGLEPLLEYGPRSSNTKHLNPVLLDKAFSFVRPHQEGATTGGMSKYNVEWILKNQMTIAETFKDIVHVPDDTDEPQEVVDAESTEDGGGKNKPSSDSSKDGGGKNKPSTSQAKKSGQGKSARGKKNVKRPRPSGASTDSPSALNDDGVEEIVKHKRQALKPSPFHWLSPFLGCDVIMNALMQLEQDPTLQSSSIFFNQHLVMLENLRRGQGCIYNAPTKFKNYYDAQERALKQYTVFNVESSPARKATFVHQIDTKFRATYANMFTRNEMVVISCLLAYPGFSFSNIDQKQSGSDGMTRGMAFVPAQLESFFFKRLRMLGLIDDVAHPKYMEPLSTVVLSSTYCYHQIVSWEEGENWVSLDEQAWKLDQFPEFLGVNGIYVRVQHTLPNEGCVLYAQVKSSKTRSSLSLQSWDCGKFGPDYARVIIVDKSNRKQWTATVHVWLSIGVCQAEDPICLAKFMMVPPSKGSIKVTNPQMFSHLDDTGIPVYQPISEGNTVQPTVTVGPKVLAGVPLEYGPQIKTRRVPVEPTFRPRDLKTQAEHCDGNFFHSKGQWVRRPDGKFALSYHVPFVKPSSMEQADKMQAIFLKGHIHLNSLSFLLGTSTNTTLTFPSEAGGQGPRDSDVVEGTPFGGCTCFAFVEKHAGSAYPDPNERPHLYAHSADLRQFPVTTATGLITILAAKQRIEYLRAKRFTFPAFLLNEMRDLEDALGHVIFDCLSTSTYKAGVQETMLNEVREAAMEHA